MDHLDGLNMLRLLDPDERAHLLANLPPETRRYRKGLRQALVE